MSPRKFFSVQKNAVDEKAASKPVKVATICVLVISSGLVMKTAYEMKQAVREIQRTVAHSVEMPEEADGAFYFIEPRTTATL